MTRVRQYHLRFGLAMPGHPPLLPNADDARAALRGISDEYTPLRDDFAKLLHVSDPRIVPGLHRALLARLAALCYAAESAATTLGLPFEEALDEIHRSNMTKTLSRSGRPVKGEGYSAPDLARLVPDHINYEEVPESHEDA